jgi:hypothetical protein
VINHRVLARSRLCGFGKNSLDVTAAMKDPDNFDAIRPDKMENYVGAGGDRTHTG